MQPKESPLKYTESKWADPKKSPRIISSNDALWSFTGGWSCGPAGASSHQPQAAQRNSAKISVRCQARNSNVQTKELPKSKPSVPGMAFRGGIGFGIHFLASQFAVLRVVSQSVNELNKE